MKKGVIVKYELTIGENIFILDNGGSAYNVMDILARYNDENLTLKVEPYTEYIICVDNDKEE